MGVAVGVAVGVCVAVAVGVGDAVAVGMGVGVVVGIGEGVVSGREDCVGDTNGVTVGLGTDVATPGAESACGIPSWSGISVGAAGVLGLEHASSRDAVVVRATNATAKATVNGFLLDAILGCLAREFMTRRCYTTLGREDCRCHNTAASGGCDSANSQDNAAERRS